LAIPPFTSSGVVEPNWDWQQHRPGDAQGTFTPHETTMDEVVDRFGTSKARRKILDGLLRYRADLRAAGLHGLGCEQWLCGSFVEQLSREPNDVDVLTLLYYAVPPTPQLRDLFDWQKTKPMYLCDAYPHPVLPIPPSVKMLTYWTGLFGHRRSNEWKGTVVVSLDAARGKDADAAARIIALGGFV
jgi:hypothetical protein